MPEQRRIIMKRMNDIVRLLLGLPKTIRFNLKYFPFKQAIRLPVFISHQVWLKELGGGGRRYSGSKNREY